MELVCAVGGHWGKAAAARDFDPPLVSLVGAAAAVRVPQTREGRNTERPDVERNTWKTLLAQTPTAAAT